MKLSSLFLCLIVWGCGNSPVYRDAPQSGQKGFAQGADNDHEPGSNGGMALTQSGTTCVRGNCKSVAEPEPLIFSRAMAEGHPTIYRDRPVWFLASEFGVNDGGPCSMIAENAMFESMPFGYQTYVLIQAGWVS